MNNYSIGSIVFENWIIRRKIGEGSFGEVFEITREDFGETYRAALKVITVPKSEVEFRSALSEGMTVTQAESYFYSVVEDIVREFALMARLKGTANVVSYEDHVVLRPKNGIGWDILIRMELLNPLLPYAYEHPFARRDIIRLGIDILKALELCQKYNIIHRDIKPENIFVSDNGDFKLGDFGIARTIEKSMSALSKKGTYNYMAPEVYRGEEYGFNVDIYSLGIVLYRLLNKNRMPFFPPTPKPITYSSRETAIAKRMSGEDIPKPFYAEGRLAEIVLKACSFDPKERYSSPAQMRQELEAILYSEEDASFIYPDGDELALDENRYASLGPTGTVPTEFAGTDRTESIFGEKVRETDKTESVFEKAFPPVESYDTDKTESVFGGTAKKPQSIGKDGSTSAKNAEKKHTKEKTGNARGRIIAAACAVVLVVGGALFIFIQNAAKEERYERLMAEGLAACETAPEDAARMFLEAQSLSPKETDPYVSYAYALCRSGKYEECIRYIEDELALGKNYDIKSQSRLSEILGTAYFEMDEYAAAASFLRMSAAGGDITVPAMRDYAVSLGRLGDVEAAQEIIERMNAAGADDDELYYIWGETSYALKDYSAAEGYFKGVLDSTKDTVLQKRSLRSLAEVYRACAVLERTSGSPIDNPATKEVELLANGIEKFGLRYDSTIWEMLGLAYFEAFHTDTTAPESYLTKAAECFNRVIELGVQKDYIYSNLYAVYYELSDFASAEDALKAYEAAFPNNYSPHALRGMMLITIENGKDQSERDYTAANREYEMAGNMISSSEDPTYYQQLESLIDQLKANSWL